MQSRRDWLASQGLAIAGARGKFSNAAKAALAKAETEGMQFSDSPNSPTAPKATKPKAPAPVVSTAADSLYLSPSDFRFPEDEYKAVEVGSKKTHSMRECCNRCRVSLTNHACDKPTIHGNIAVSIVRR